MKCVCGILILPKQWMSEWGSDCLPISEQGNHIGKQQESIALPEVIVHQDLIIG